MENFNYRADRAQLDQALRMLRPATSNRATLPILRAVHLRAEKGKRLCISGTDLDVFVRVWVEGACDSSADGCVMFTPLSRAAQMFKAPVLCLAQNDFFEIDGLEARADCIPINPEDFPHIPGVTPTQGQFQISAHDLSFLLSCANVFCSKEESRSILMGFMLQWNERGLLFGATDTHRLGMVRAAITHIMPYKSGAMGAEPDVIVPADIRQSLMLGLKYLKPKHVTITVGASQVSFSFDGYELISRIMDGKFPNWEKVVPATSERRAIVKRENLRDAVRAARVVCSDSQNGSRCLLRFTGSNIEFFLGGDSILDEQTARYKHRVSEVYFSVDKFEIAVNTKYLFEALNVLSCEYVEFAMNGQLNPIVVREYDFGKKLATERITFVLMPMQCEYESYNREWARVRA